MERDLPRSYRFGDFSLDTANRQLQEDSTEIFLRPKTFDTLLCLVEHHGRLVKKDDLMDRVWANTYVTEAVLTHCIAEARKALRDDPLDPRYIKTIPRVGYRFIAGVTETLLINEDSRREAQPAANSSLLALPPVKAPLEEPNEETAKRRWPRAKYWMVAFAAVVITVGISGYLRFFPRQPALAEPAIVPVTTVGAGHKDGYLSLSPDGKWIAFCSTGEKQDNWDLYVKEVDGPALNRITTHPAEDNYPSWSPDGRRLAFIRNSGGRRSLNVVSLMGGAEQTLMGLEAGLRLQVQNSTAWSADGKEIAFSWRQSQNSRWAIWSITVDSLEKNQLTDPSHDSRSDFDPAYSPDGRYLAFCRGWAPTSSLYVMSLPRGTPILLDGSGWANHPSWTTDSREVVFATTNALWRISVQGGAARRIPTRGHYIHYASVGRNRLAYLTNSGTGELWRLDLTGKTPFEPPFLPLSFGSSSGTEMSPRISPDGNRIVFASDQSGAFEIWVLDRKGTEPIQLTHLKTKNCGSPSWSPDGKWIAFDSIQDVNSDLFLVSAEGGPAQRITTESTNEVVPQWSRDGRSIYFGSDRSGDWQIWKMPSNGGQPVQVTRKGGMAAVELGDGYVYYYHYPTQKRGVWRVPESGGPETLVTDAVTDWQHWDLTQWGIYFTKSGSPGSPLICFYDFSSGRVSELARTHSDPGFSVGLGLSVSPDGKWLIYPGFVFVADFMLIDNFR